MKLYYGCSQWGYESWRGSLYPANAGSHDFLRYYSRMFNSVELNSTYHQGADPANLLRWKNKVKPGFRFCPKVPKTISHAKKLINIDEDLRSFLQGVNTLGENLGVIFLQLNKYFDERDFAALNDFLKMIPEEFMISVELRIPQMQDAVLIDGILTILKKNKAGVVITDSIESREYINNIRLTNHNAFVRFIAYGHETDYSRIDEWFKQIEKWSDKGLPAVYFFLHFPVELYDTGLVEYFLRKTEQFN
jgi:uncharacterized protein YecE (DUF72 family)